MCSSLASLKNQIKSASQLKLLQQHISMQKNCRRAPALQDKRNVAWLKCTLLVYKNIYICRITKKNTYTPDRNNVQLLEAGAAESVSIVMYPFLLWCKH